MTERPILFSGEMVRAILDGRKTQTRRVLARQPLDILPMNRPNEWVGLMSRDPNRGIVFKCKYGVPGDALWMREGYQIRVIEFDVRRIVRGKYLADDARFSQVLTPSEWKKLNARKYRYRPTSGRFMYKSLSRCKLQITDVRVERVQDISEEDAIREGVTDMALDDIGNTWHTYRRGFQCLWNSINYKRGFGWDVNPWVWVVQFQMI